VSARTTGNKKGTAAREIYQKSNSKFYKMTIVYYLGQEFENFFFMQMNWQEFVASDEKGSDET